MHVSHFFREGNTYVDLFVNKGVASRLGFFFCGTQLPILLGASVCAIDLLSLPIDSPNFVHVFWLNPPLLYFFPFFFS